MVSCDMIIVRWCGNLGCEFCGNKLDFYLKFEREGYEVLSLFLSSLVYFTSLYTTIGILVKENNSLITVVE